MKRLLRMSSSACSAEGRVKVGKAAGVGWFGCGQGTILADAPERSGCRYFDASGKSLLLTCVMTRSRREPIMQRMADLALAGAMPDSSSGAIRLPIPDPVWLDRLPRGHDSKANGANK